MERVDPARDAALPLADSWRAWLVVLSCRRLVAHASCSPLLSNTFTVPGTDSERVRTVLAGPLRRPQRRRVPVVFRVRDRHRRRHALRLAARASTAAAAASRRAGRPLLRAAGPHVVYGNILTTLDLADAKGYTDDLVRALRAAAGVDAYVTGQPAIQADLDPIFSRDLARRVDRAADRARRAAAVFGLSWAVTIPFLFAAATIIGTLGIVYVIAHYMTMATYVTNLVLADRAGDRDRLLAADRLPLPRGARARRAGGRRDRADDGDRRARGGLLRRDGGDRARAADLHAAAVHALDGDRRLPDPARLARRRGRRCSRRCSRSSGGAARSACTSRTGCGASGCRCRTSPDRTSSTASGRASRARSCGGRSRLRARRRGAAPRGASRCPGCS